MPAEPFGVEVWRARAGVAGALSMGILVPESRAGLAEFCLGPETPAKIAALGQMGKMSGTGEALALGLAVLAVLAVVIVAAWRALRRRNGGGGAPSGGSGAPPGACGQTAPPPWLGYNVMLGGYSVPCLEKVLRAQGGRLALRNNLSSYLNPAGPQYWEKDLRAFLDAHPGAVSLYTCLQWGSETDLSALGQMPYLEYVQVNGGVWHGTPRSDNPTEDSLVELPGFVLDDYLGWLARADRALRPGVALVIPFKQFSAQPPGSATPRDVAMGKVLDRCAALQKASGRPFGVETTIYPFWGGQAAAAPSATALAGALGAFQGVAAACAARHGFTRLDPIVAESGWPSACTGHSAGRHGATVASRGNARAYWRQLKNYRPSSGRFRLYFWQFEDVDNGDGCGKTWGGVDPATCCWL